MKIPSEHVKFYKKEKGFHANIKNMHPLGSSYFVPRVKKGKINLYESRTAYYNTYNSRQVAVTSLSNSYYNMGFGDIKPPKYKNLFTDLSDNP
jgi:hypothetical protein